MTEVTSAPRTAPPLQRDWVRIILVGIVAAAAVIASFHAQAGLGERAGWHAAAEVLGVQVSLSWLLPLCVDAYGATATRIAVASARYSEHTRRHALVHAIAAVVVGVLGNATYHLLAAKVLTLGSATWILVVAVSIIPPVALGALAHLMALCARDDAEAHAEAVPDPGSFRIDLDASVPVRNDPAASVPGATRNDPERSAPVRVHPEPAVPAAAPAVLLPADAVPAARPQEEADPWPAFAEDLAMPSGRPDPYPRSRLAVPGDEHARGEVPTAVTGVPVDVPEPREVYLRAVEVFAPDGAVEQLPPIRQVKQALSCGQDRAKEVRAYLAGFTEERSA